MATDLPDFYNDLSLTLSHAWQVIEAGAHDSRSPYHVFQVASLNPDNGPNIRSVVLRAVDPSNRLLRFHTDCYSLKVRSIEADPRIAALFYDPAGKIQIRMQGRAHVLESGAIVDSAWENSQRMSRACYGSEPPPGTRIDSGGDYWTGFDPDQPDNGRDAFRVVLLTVWRLEWLFLHSAGHRRAVFNWSGNGTLSESKWLVP